MGEKWDYNWPIDEFGNKKSIANFTSFEQVKYQVWQARIECTINNTRYIDQEVLYLMNWYVYFEVLTKMDQFDPECLKYLHYEIVRLYKERIGWM